MLDEGPKGGDTALVNTWSAGTLRAGETRELTWRLVAVTAGTYTSATASRPASPGARRPPRAARAGRLHVTIADEPVPARVGEDGEVVRGVEPGSPTRSG